MSDVMRLMQIELDARRDKIREQEQTITQQAQELEQAKSNYAIQKAAADDYEQQLAASQARCREECAKIAERNTYMNPNADGGGNHGGPGSCEYGCGNVIAKAIRELK